MYQSLIQTRKCQEAWTHRTFIHETLVAPNTNKEDTNTIDVNITTCYNMLILSYLTM